MNSRSDSAPAPESRSLHPGFLPYRRLRDELIGLPVGEWVVRCNTLALRRNLRSATGAPLRFFTDDGATGALAYEAAIYHAGTIPCRRAGRGALHDLHNALVWLTFPQTKATLNRLHVEAGRGGSGLGHRAESGTSGRGRVRDAVTLLDESGLLWLSKTPALDAQLLGRDWRTLLFTNRQEVREQVLPVIIGHGLLDKLASPYKSMTAHCLVCSERWVVATAPDPAGIDADAARAVAASFAAGAPPALAALPILGLPGWSADNDDPSYYDDARVFRA